MDVLTLAAVLKFNKDQFDKGLDSALDKAQSVGGKLKSVLGGAAKAIGATTALAAGAVGKLASGAVSAYGEYQQLEGGIQTLFGKDASKMLVNASKAFQTAGVSANQYMEMAIQSSASMINSLNGDTQRAAELMDMSIIDMSDNVNKMGTTMEAVQNAYRGFSRGNFTMLDNLALGYAGTKKGMEELLKDAEAIAKKNGQNVQYSIDSYADMVEAIHVVQTEMGITGTTSKEAGDTITGSAGSAKAAWENLKVALASGSDAKLERSLDNLISSVTVMAENVIPIFEKALNGVGKMIQKIVPIISGRLPQLIQDILPGLLSAVSSLIEGIVKALPSLLNVLVENVPTVLNQVVDAIMAALPDAIDAITNMIETLVEALPDVIKNLASKLPTILKQLVKAIKKVLPEIIKAGTDLIKDLAQGMADGTGNAIDVILDLLDTILSSIIDNLPKILDAGMMILEKLVDGIIENLPKIADAVFQIVERLGQTIIEKLPEILEKGRIILEKLIQGIIDNLPKIIQAAVEVIKNLAKSLIDNLPKILEAGVKLILELAKGIFQALPDLLVQIPQIIIDLVSSLLSPEGIGRLLDAGFQIISNIFTGLFDGDFGETAGKVIEALLGAILAIPGMIMEIGAKIVGFILDGIKGAWNGVVDFVESGIEALLGDVNAARDQALAVQAEIQAMYEGEKAQNRRRYNEYGSAYGITGQESFASSNTQAEIYAERERNRQANNRTNRVVSSGLSQAAAATGMTINLNTYVDGSKAATTSKNVQAMREAFGGGY